MFLKSYSGAIVLINSRRERSGEEGANKKDVRGDVMVGLGN